MLKHLLFTIIFFGLISCSAYQKISVSPEDALNKGKVKVITNSGNEVKLENIIYEDSVFIGMKDSVKIPINPSQIQSIYLAYSSKLPLKKNVVYASIAVSNLSINYERILVTKNVFNILFKASIGEFYFPESWGAPSYTGAQFLVQFIMLHGRASNYIEYGIGLGSWYQQTGYNNAKESYENGHSLILPQTGEYIEFFPAVNFGYRYQKSGYSPVFRVGIGYPEILYVSIGISF